MRCPNGIEGERFFQKHLGPGFGSAIHRKEIPENDGKLAEYAWIDDLPGLLSLAQMNVLEFHPWGSQVRTLEKPDRVIFDLDPDPGIGWPKIKAAAHELRDALVDLGLQSFPRLSGGKGVHLVVPIAKRHSWDTARDFCDRFAHEMEARAPQRYVATMSKAKREGRIFIDWLRNGRGATAVASWSLRARPGAPVAMPVTWDEFARVRAPDRFKLRDALKRLDAPIWDPDLGRMGYGRSAGLKLKNILEVGKWPAPVFRTFRTRRGLVEIQLAAESSAFLAEVGNRNQELLTDWILDRGVPLL